MVWKTLSVNVAGPWGNSVRKNVRYREVDGVREVQVAQEQVLDLYGSVDEVIEMLRHESKNLVEARLDEEVEYGSYGDRDRDRVYLRGWSTDVSDDVRVAVDAEIGALPQKQREEQERRRAAAKEQMDRLLQQFPDLLED